MSADKLDKIKFGTDGWRGIIGFDFNLSNLSRVVVAACQELHYQYYKEVNSKKIIIGYDPVSYTHLTLPTTPYV